MIKKTTLLLILIIGLSTAAFGEDGRIRSLRGENNTTYAVSNIISKSTSQAKYNNVTYYSVPSQNKRIKSKRLRLGRRQNNNTLSFQAIAMKISNPQQANIQ